MPFSMHKEAFPSSNLFESCTLDGRVAVFFPVEACERVSIKVEAKFANGVLVLCPRCGLLMER